MTQFTLRLGSAVLYRGESLSAVAALVQANRVTLRPAPADDLRFFSVCSGIEAASVAWKPIGWKCIGVAEIEKFPSAVLAHHYPDIPNHGDFTKIETKRLGRVDVLCGGTPCQAFSVAGARRSLDDARGNLTLAFVGLAYAINPRNVVWENVPGVLSTKDNAFGCFLAGLVGADDALPPPNGKRWPNAGMVHGPKGRTAWRVLDAQYFGLAQRRKRVILVADFGNGADPAAVLFEPESLRRDSPPSRETGQRVTGTISALSSGGGGLGTDLDLDGGLLAHSLRAQHNDPQDYTKGTYIPQLARRNATREGQSQDFESTTMVAVSVTDRASHALKAEGADASEDGTGRGTPIVAFDCKASGQSGFGVGEIASTMRAMAHSGSHQNGGGHLAVAYAVALRGREDGGTAELGGDIGFALRASGGDKPHVLAFQGRGSNIDLGQDVTGTLLQNCDRASGGAPCITVMSAVRRLTPRECERLQGFQFLVSPTFPGAWQDSQGRWWSPDYTAIPWRGKHASLCPDGPRYKALGNSWAVPKFRWLGSRIAALMPRE